MPGGILDWRKNDELEHELLNVVIYPQNLPNAAPETWITHRPDLECICSHSSIIGWSSTTSHGSSGKFFECVDNKFSNETLYPFKKELILASNDNISVHSTLVIRALYAGRSFKHDPNNIYLTFLCIHTSS